MSSTLPAMTEKTFDISATNACKGIALMLLLWHHLFIENPEYGRLVYETAHLAKVCVAIFVILSGYGLAESLKSKSMGLFAFYKKRLARLYLDYWFIAAVFVPIGVVWMDRPIGGVFKTYPYLKFALQLGGIDKFFTWEHGYNATWWFMSLIVGLYILFPFIHNLTKKYGLWFLLFCALPLIPYSKWPAIPVLDVWILPFALGIYISHLDGFTSMSSLLGRTGVMRFAVLGLLLIAVALSRTYGIFSTGARIDSLFGSLVILLTFELIALSGMLEGVLVFLGKHLFNIFLFHAFIFRYYWSEAIYFFRYPVVIFLVLLLVCLLISALLEELKKRLAFPRLAERIERIKIPDRINV